MGAGNKAGSWCVLMGARERRWGPVHIDGGQGMKVEAKELWWGPGNIGGGWGTLVGAGEHWWGRWGLGPVWRRRRA